MNSLRYFGREVGASHGPSQARNALTRRLAMPGARFPKFVLHRSTHLSRTSERHGHQQTFNSSAPPRFEVPGSGLQLAVQELQIGGTRFDRYFAHPASLPNP